MNTALSRFSSHDTGMLRTAKRVVLTWNCKQTTGVRHGPTGVRQTPEKYGLLLQLQGWLVAD
jgi:hypothetical protein